jgi:hypothetical protein
MSDSFSPDTFYDSAREFAITALEAHHSGNYRRVALDAGTALEHLAKACLARRSPALLAELKGEQSVASLAWLLEIDGAKLPPKVRTVGLSDALSRTDSFVTSTAAREDLQTLVDMRNGVVHAAQNAEIEGRILAAFAQHPTRCSRILAGTVPSSGAASLPWLTRSWRTPATRLRIVSL